ncbi:MAG: hypothetical protein RR704_26395, partial [Stenotrophomonas sp.]
QADDGDADQDDAALAQSSALHTCSGTLQAVLLRTAVTDVSATAEKQGQTPACRSGVSREAHAASVAAEFVTNRFISASIAQALYDDGRRQGSYQNTITQQPEA